MKNIFIIIVFFCVNLLPNKIISKPFDNSNALEQKDLLWANFRNKFNYHIQLIGVIKYEDKSINIIIAEPSNRVTIEDIKSKTLKINATFEIKKWTIYKITNPVGQKLIFKYK